MNSIIYKKLFVYFYFFYLQNNSMGGWKELNPQPAKSQSAALPS